MSNTTQRKTATDVVKNAIDTGIDMLATLVNDCAKMEGRIMDQVIVEMRLRVAYLGWGPAKFKDETSMRKLRSKESDEFNKGRMASLLKTLKARKFIKVLYQLTWKENSKGKVVANAGAVQLTDESSRETGTVYTARYSNTHNTLNAAFLLFAWHNPAGAFKALKADDAIAKIHAWKQKYDSDAADAKHAQDLIDAENGTGNASGEADQAPPLPTDAPPVLSEAYNAAESFKRAATAFCDHDNDTDILAEYVAQVQAIASEIIELASGEPAETEPVSDADMAEKALMAVTAIANA